MTTAALCVLLTLHVSCKHLMEDTNIQSPRESHNTYVHTCMIFTDPKFLTRWPEKQQINLEWPNKNYTLDLPVTTEFYTNIQNHTFQLIREPGMAAVLPHQLHKVLKGSR